MKAISWVVLSTLTVFAITGCTSEEKKVDQQEAYLDQQQDEQGYPVLIASPVSLDYGLPFCEKQYCIEIEIFGFKSKDQWFNSFVEHQIADLIRKQLHLKEKHSLQSAVNEFVRLSDAWQQKDKKPQPWQLYIYSNVVGQQEQITILRIDTEYKIENQDIPQQSFYFVVDRKAQKLIRLYDLVNENSRLAFGQFIQSEYQAWLDEQEDSSQYPSKISWATQDWYFDEEGIIIDYKMNQEQRNLHKAHFQIFMSKKQANDWLKKEYMQQLYLN